MFFIPAFLRPKRNLIKILQINAGVRTEKNVKRLLKSLDVYCEPLPSVFLLATAIYKLGKSQLSKQLAGVISHETFGNAMNMAAFQKICKLYNKNNIPVFAQKGLVQKILYPQSVRPMNDADFTVPKDVYRKAINIAVENGFHINHDLVCSADLQLRDMGCIDVHYAIFKGSNPAMDELMFSRSTKKRFMDTDILIPCAEDILVIIMCEFYCNFLFEAGSKLTDIKQIFASHPQWVLDAHKIICDNPNLSWGKIMQTAKMSGYDYQIKILAKLLNKIIPGAISTHAWKVIDSLCPDEIVHRYLRRDKKLVRLHRGNHKFYKTMNI